MDIISQADWLVDMGLGAGKYGGNIIFEGTPQDILADRFSLTGKHLTQLSGFYHELLSNQWFSDLSD
jgi:excinuclease UvrABC ATPase subunit